MILEVALIFVVGLNHNTFIAGLAAASELFMIWSTWWAVKRYRIVKSLSAG